jgi:hypothetical protein
VGDIRWGVAPRDGDEEMRMMMIKMMERRRRRLVGRDRGGKGEKGGGKGE